MVASHRTALLHNMAFNFQPIADLSSDEEGGAPLDLAAWKSNSTKKTTPKQAPAPVAQMMPSAAADDSDDEVASTTLEAFQSSNKRQRTSASTTPAPMASTASGFTSVNRPSAILGAVDPADDEIEMPDFDANNIPVDDGEPDDEPEEEDDDEDELAGKPLFPILPRTAVEEEEIVDLTGGDDAVRRVLKELESDDGAVMYEVELGDYSVEEVRSTFLVSSSTRGHGGLFLGISTT